MMPTDPIATATKQLKQAIEGHTTKAPAELKAVASMHALITGTQPDPPLPDPPIPHCYLSPVKRLSSSLRHHRICIQRKPLKK
jgi:hypothetical protein